MSAARTTEQKLLAALQRMLDAFYADPLGSDTDGAIEEALEAVALAKATGDAA